MREIGGLDHKVIRGAGVDSILHTVLIEGITNCGASLIFSSNCNGSLVKRARFTEVIRDGVLFVSLSRALFPRGVLLDGVLSCFDGVREVVASFPPAFLGVEEVLFGVGGADLFFEVVFPIDFSRKV